MFVPPCYGANPFALLLRKPLTHFFFTVNHVIYPLSEYKDEFAWIYGGHGMSAMVSSPTVMVIDDRPENLRVLEDMLRGRGYRVMSFPRGDLALRAAMKGTLDLILLDIRMPGLDGYQVCERLKADERLRDIPVIFISALDETVDKVKAFGIGGVDYITKPFQLDEVMARVSTHLQLRRLRIELQEKYDELRDLERLRDNLVHMVAHDMRNLLMVIDGALQCIGGGQNPKDMDEQVRWGRDAYREMVNMVESLLDVSRLEEGKMSLRMSKCDLRNVIQKAMDHFDPLLHDVKLSRNLPQKPLVAWCDPALIGRVVTNLVGNALKFTPKRGNVTVASAQSGNAVQVRVVDTGRGIPPELHNKIFEKFCQADARKQREKYSAGLGLTFCKLAVEAHGGRIGLESEVGKGSTFWFELPARRKRVA
jgi:two-component system, sensor histidine kinase and response regulator